MRRPVHVITSADTRTGRTARHVARHAATTLVGCGSWWRRGWSAATHGVHRRAITSAEQLGDREALAAALDRLEKAKNDRARRLRELPVIVAGLIRTTVVGLVLLGLLLVVLGLAVQLTPGGWTWGDWWDAVTTLVTTVGDLLFLAVAIAVWAAVPAVLLAGWLEGRRVAGLPRWLRTAAEADLDVAIDETTIAQALDALRIPQIRDYLKAGHLLQFIVTCREDGRGTFCRIRLPRGVTAERIAKRRADLATGLYRLAKECWPTTGDEEGVLDLWVADKGALARAGREIPGSGPRAELVERDLLEDLDAVLGSDPVPIADVPALLAAYAPGWAPYRSLTGKALRERLKARYGVKVASTGNRWPLDPAAVRAALARRATADLDEEE